MTIGVYKSFRNSGHLRFHRNKTKKHWKHFFIDTDDGNFYAEWVSSFKAHILKRKVCKKRKMFCLECGHGFYAYLKNENDDCECPNCGN